MLNTDNAIVSETIGERAIVELAAERPQRLEPGEHDARCARRSEQRHRPELPRRRPARDSEQPVARRHQLIVQPAGRDEHAPDRRCGDGDSGADRQHLGRVRLLSRRPRQRRHQERHQQPRTAPSSSSSRTMRSTSAATSRTAANPKNPRRRNQFGFQADGPVVIPKLYDGRNKTFFMGAYEGVASRGDFEPVRLGADGADAAGKFLRNHRRRSEIPFTGQPFPGNIIPAVDAVARSLKLLAVLSGAEPAPGTAQQLPGARARTPTTSTSCWLASTRTSATRSGCTCATTGTTASTATSSTARFPITGSHAARVNKNTLFSYTHTLRPNLVNDFRIGYHRIDFDTLNYFAVNGIDRRAPTSASPGSTATCKYNNPGIPSINVSNFSGPWRRRLELVPVRHDVSGLERARLHARVAQRPRRDSTCGGWRPDAAPRTTRAGCSRSMAT